MQEIASIEIKRELHDDTRRRRIRVDLFVMPSNIAPPIFSLASAEFVHNDTCATGLGGHCNPVGRVG